VWTFLCPLIGNMCCNHLLAVVRAAPLDYPLAMTTPEGLFVHTMAPFLSFIALARDCANVWGKSISESGVAQTEGKGAG